MRCGNSFQRKESCKNIEMQEFISEERVSQGNGGEIESKPRWRKIEREVQED